MLRNLKEYEYYWSLLRNAVMEFYREKGIICSCVGFVEDGTSMSFDFFIKKRYVIRYTASIDAKSGMGDDYQWGGGVGLGFGPVFISPSDFWDYQNSERFSMSLSEKSIVQNLELLEEFLNTII